MAIYHVYSDGGSVSALNSYYSFVVYEADNILGENKQHRYSFSSVFKNGTSNRAEYYGMRDAFCFLVNHMSLAAHDVVIFYTDSKLAANQVLGTWKTKDSSLIELRDGVRHHLHKLQLATSSVQIVHVGRKNNQVADKLCQYAAVGILKDIAKLSQDVDEFLTEAKEKKKCLKNSPSENS
jgi:ribonuclease HI